MPSCCLFTYETEGAVTLSKEDDRPGTKDQSHNKPLGLFTIDRQLLDYTLKAVHYQQRWGIWDEVMRLCKTLSYTIK